MSANSRSLKSYGVSTVVVLVAWLTALVAGRLPEPLHQGIAAGTLNKQAAALNRQAVDLNAKVSVRTAGSA
jgi:hypothetical protein